MPIPPTALLQLWGKARPAADASVPFHPLLYHCLDVAAVAETLLCHRPRRIAELRRLTGLDEEPLIRFVAFLVALHDLGKTSPWFLAQSEPLWPAGLLGPYPGPYPATMRHDAAGLWLFEQMEDSALPFPPLPRVLQQLVFGHHGRPVGNTADPRPIAGVFHDVALAVVQALAAALEPPAVHTKNADWKCPGWFLAGLIVLADWIGSQPRWFPYHPPVLEPVTYWRTVARRAAPQAVEAAGIQPARPGSASGYHALTGDTRPPSPIQHWAQTAPLPEEGPLLVLVEDMTGGGKTEAALILAQRLMAADRAQGIYVALPTMATADAMYRRLASCYRRLFAMDKTPSLILAHGAAQLHEGFCNSLLDTDSPPCAPPPSENCAPHQDEAEGDEAGAACAAWLADDRRKAFLADIGVGTIDQALLAILPAKYQSLRLFGLADRVLIVDEAHAYDEYTGTLLEKLVTFQAALGGHAIVLSATLPETRRHALVHAFLKGSHKGKTACPALTETGYPRVTLASTTAPPVEQRQNARPDLRRTLTVERLPDDPAAISAIADAYQNGAAVLWVRNAIDDGLDAVARLAQAGIPAIPFHARYAMGDRLDREREVLGRFGKQSDPAGRHGVIVASPVIEQSLDVDFDLVISDLAPMDLLLQRAGRLWRHDRGLRPIPGPRLLVVSPDPAGLMSAGWFRDAFPRAAPIYPNHARLWLTAEALFQKTRHDIPEDVRSLIEAVYAEDAEARVPAHLERNFREAEGEGIAARCIANTQILRPDKGYGEDLQAWSKDAHAPTRLGEQRTTLRLARLEGTEVVPWCPADNRRRAWALSEVSVRATRIQGVPEPAGALKAAVRRARQSWTRYDADTLLLVLSPTETDAWTGAVIDGKKQIQTLRYTRTFGLQLPP